MVVADALTPGRRRRRRRRRAPVRTVGVVGSGTMATGIIEVFAKARLRRASTSPAATEKVAQVAQQALTTLAGQGACCAASSSEADRDAALGRVTGTTSLDDLADRDLVVEAVVEELSVKQALFADLDEICKPGAVLATTTSSLPVIECAAATGRPADVVGLHFFNPAPVMKLVEVVPHRLARADDVVGHRARGLRAAGQARRSSAATGPASSSTRCCSRTSTTRCKMLEAHYATADDIDAAMKVGCGYPMGPFELLDVVGLDVVAGHPARALPRVPRARLRARRRCSSTWSPPATSAARPAAASATTPSR